MAKVEAIGVALQEWSNELRNQVLKKEEEVKFAEENLFEASVRVNEQKLSPSLKDHGKKTRQTGLNFFNIKLTNTPDGVVVEVQQKSRFDTKICAVILNSRYLDNLACDDELNITSLKIDETSTVQFAVCPKEPTTFSLTTRLWTHAFTSDSNNPSHEDDELDYNLAPEEVALVLRYWKGVITGDRLVVAASVTKDIVGTASGTFNGVEVPAVTFNGRKEVVQGAVQISSMIAAVQETSLKIINENGKVHVTYDQQFLQPDGRIMTCQGKQVFTVLNNNDTWQFSEFVDNEQLTLPLSWGQTFWMAAVDQPSDHVPRLRAQKANADKPISDEKEKQKQMMLELTAFISNLGEDRSDIESVTTNAEELVVATNQSPRSPRKDVAKETEDLAIKEA